MSDLVERLQMLLPATSASFRPYIEEAAAEIDRLREERRCIPVTERLPERGVEVLVFVDGRRGPAWSNNYSLVAYRCAVSGAWLQERHAEAEPIVGVTHWQPLSVPSNNKE